MYPFRDALGPSRSSTAGFILLGSCQCSRKVHVTCRLLGTRGKTPCTKRRRPLRAGELAPPLFWGDIESSTYVPAWVPTSTHFLGVWLSPGMNQRLCWLWKDFSVWNKHLEHTWVRLLSGLSGYILQGSAPCSRWQGKNSACTFWSSASLPRSSDMEDLQFRVGALFQTLAIILEPFLGLMRPTYYITQTGTACQGRESLQKYFGPTGSDEPSIEILICPPPAS